MGKSTLCNIWAHLHMYIHLLEQRRSFHYLSCWALNAETMLNQPWLYSVIRVNISMLNRFMCFQCPCLAARHLGLAPLYGTISGTADPQRRLSLVARTWVPSVSPLLQVNVDSILGARFNVVMLLGPVTLNQHRFNVDSKFCASLKKCSKRLFYNSIRRIPASKLYK